MKLYRHHGSMTLSPRARMGAGWALASLALGLLGILCCGVVAGVPAIVCGYVARGKILSQAQGSRERKMALAGRVLGWCSFLTTILMCCLFIRDIWEPLQSMRRLHDAHQIYLAMQSMAQEKNLIHTAGKQGFPADVGIASSSALKQALIAGRYLTAEEAENLDFDRFLIGNISVSDAEGTIAVRSRPDTANRNTVVIWKGGAGRIYRLGEKVSGVDSPREPAYLPP